MKSALTIAGSDPTGGAGLQADLKVFRAFNVYGLSVPAALTAQNTYGVEVVASVEKAFFIVQLEVLLRDIKPDAVKTGMLYSAWAVEETAEKVRDYGLRNLVIDPVTVSSTGRSLVEDTTLDRMRDVLFPLSRVITPNIYEASVLTGIHIETGGEIEEAAIELKKMGPEVVVITGGHHERLATDLYYDGTDFHKIESPRIAGEYHGTGCAFSAAITASLSTGCSPLESVKKAKEFVTSAIRNSLHLGKGMGLLKL